MQVQKFLLVLLTVTTLVSSQECLFFRNRTEEARLTPSSQYLIFDFGALTYKSINVEVYCYPNVCDFYVMKALDYENMVNGRPFESLYAKENFTAPNALDSIPLSLSVASSSDCM